MRLMDLTCTTLDQKPKVIFIVNDNGGVTS